MTHQEAIVQIVSVVLAQNEAVVQAFCRGNPFDKLLRSYYEFTADGLPLYRKKRGADHYRYSVRAYASGIPADKLYGEHRIPLTIIIRRLLACDGTMDAVRDILASNEVVLITDQEQQYLDSSVLKGGLGLRSRMPEEGGCRFDVAGIQIPPATLTNHL